MFQNCSLSFKKVLDLHFPSSSGRARINLSGAIDLLSHRIFIREEESLSTHTTITFLKQVEEAYPIERLWKWMKEAVVYNTYYEEFETFKEAILGLFNLLQDSPSDSRFGQHLRN